MTSTRQGHSPNVRPSRETLFKGEWNVLLVKSIATSLKGNVVGCDGMKCHKTQEMLMNQNASVNAEKSEINLEIIKANNKKGCDIQVNNLS